MGILRIYLGQAGSGKTTALFKDCIKNAEKDIRKNHIVIVPEQVSHMVTEKLILESESHAIMNIDVLSFQRLAHRIFDNAGNDDKEIIDDTGKNLILKTVIEEHKDEMTVLKRNIGFSGYVNEIKSVISEFVQYEISPEDVKKLSESESRIHLRSKLRDIYVLYKAFREKIEEKYVTKEELLDRASEASERADFLKGADIYLDDFTGFTPIQYRFLENIFGIVDNVSLCLNYDGKDGTLFELSVSTIAKIRSIAEEKGLTIETVHFYDGYPSRFDENPELSHLEKNLFREKKAPALFSDESAVRIIKCDTPEKECAFIISEIMRLVREEGMRFKDIGIIMSDPGNYGRLLSEEAEDENVPLFIDSTTEILLNPYTEFIRSALEVVSENMSYETVFRFLRTGLLSIEREDVDRLENYVRALGIRGRKSYTREFRIHIKDQTEEDLELINTAREKLLSVIEPFMDAMKGKGKTAGIYTDELLKFLDSTGAREKIGEMADAFKEENNLRAAGIYGQIADKTDELLIKIKNLIPDEKTDLTGYLEMLTAGFEAIRIGVLPSGMDSVKAGDMTRSRMNDIRVLIFAGMNDGLIPEVNSGSGILSDFDREAIGKNGVTLSPTAREKIGLNKLYFYMNVTKPGEKLYLTYSLGNSEGQTLRPSFFLQEINKILPGVKEEYFKEEEYRKRFFTKRDVLLFFASILKDEERLEEAKELLGDLSAIPGLRAEADTLLDSIYRINTTDRISEALSRVLYENDRSVSPTRLEKFAECAYRHFMLYGLRAMEREEFGFERRDLGSVLHGVLNLCGGILLEEGKRFSDLDDREAEELADRALDRYLRENENLVLLSSKRNKYFVTRIGRILNTTIKALRSQAGKGSFNAEKFERGFEHDGMHGRIDRIDTAENGTKLYVSIIDYKSGNKEFDLSRIYYGLDLQLTIYLNGALEIERIEHPDKEVLPAGIFYYHIDDPLIKEKDLKTGSDEEIKELRMDSLKLRGIVNSDPEVISLFDGDFEKKSSVIPVTYNKDGSFSAYSSVSDSEGFKVIRDHVIGKAFEFKKRIRSGEIEASPAKYNGKSPCEYCEFADCCGFEKGREGFAERRLKKIKDDFEIIKMMEECPHPSAAPTPSPGGRRL